MRGVSSDLMNEIMAGTIANCLKLTLKDGSTHGYTDYKETLTVDGVTYNPAPGFQKVKMNLTANAEVSNQKFGSAWVDAPEEDLLGGKFDSAMVEVAWVSWRHPQFGRLVVFTGQLGEVNWTPEGFEVDIVSYMKNLSVNIGNVFTANCRHTLFSTAKVGHCGYCGVNKASFTQTGSIASVVTGKWVFTISGSQPSGYYSNGLIKFTSGFNNGLSAVIKSHEGNQITLMLPTAFAVNAGDTFEIQAGCDKTLETCKTKFNNIYNFGGFPHIQTDASL